MGILKTIGFTGNRLIRLQMFQYLLGMGVGILLGILAAVPAARAVGELTLTTTGVLIPADLPVLPCVATFTVIFLLLLGFTFLKLRKILSVTPMRVIRGETAEMKWRPGRIIRMEEEG